jgi:uncharacterized protein YbjT (DUF2867 family)
VKAFINMSQMTVSQMSITETTPSPQHKLHWLAEQALNWSGLPVMHLRPTVFLEGFFLTLTPDSVRESDQIRLPFGEGKTSPVAAEDVARGPDCPRNSGLACGLEFSVSRRITLSGRMAGTTRLELATSAVCRRVVAVPSRLVIRAYEISGEEERLSDTVISVPV